MTENEGEAKTLRSRRFARTEWLEEKWDEIRPNLQDDPDWLRQLATQLELWVGDELDDPLYLEVSYGPVPDDAVSESSTLLLWNALNSDTLYLRALTKSHFVAVDVQKASGQVAEATVSVVLVPRSHLESLQAVDLAVGDSRPDTVRLTLHYSNTSQSFQIPHSDDYSVLSNWRTRDDLRVFSSLRDDLRTEAVAAGKPVIDIH
ncbi:MAG: hypothetical protein K0R99_3004 [Microbacterium sp.]|jgi:hypothetical protein|uniref:hypothetical protein n=1 Tax=Microbacterium sp. TaxID=51671 RepID=UPI0026092696|nr:hypothetical protein [Microbacterium sp.]MDF2561558.1 hypothetical protein [Microbacterium sp.]